MTPRLMLAATYRIHDLDVSVCLGVRFGGPNDIARLERLLIKQVRDRYPVFFEGMRLPAVRQVVELTVYDADKIDRNGFAPWLGPSAFYR